MSRPRRRNAAFTLLETLIALALVTTLMVLAWSLFATFSRLETRARKQVAGLEITRTLNQQMQSDLDQLVRFAQKNQPVSETAQDAESGLNELTESFARASRNESASGTIADDNSDAVDEAGYPYVFASPFFEGDSESISFLVPSSTESETGRWKVVSYEWTQGNQSNEQDLDFDDEEPGSNLLTSESSVDVSSTALNSESRTARIFTRKVLSYQKFQQNRNAFFDSSRDGLLDGLETIEVGTAQSDVELLAEDQSVVTTDEIPEISEISFRYFDGQSWSSGFSSASGDYPVAIEVVFKIRSQIENVVEGQDSNSGTGFGDEITVGVTENELEFESDPDGEFNNLDLNPNFEPDSRRFLIYLGSARFEKMADNEESPGTLDFEFPGIGR